MRRTNKTLHAGPAFAAAAVAALLAWALWPLATPAPGLQQIASAALPDSGVANPVTAVVLNFRGYDTLLEVGVLLLTLTGVWSLGPVEESGRATPVDPLLPGTVRLLVPMMLLVAGFLLWQGSHAAGGGFQAGAVLAAALVLSLLADMGIAWLDQRRLLRGLLALGLVSFLAVAVAMLGIGGGLLTMPPTWAGALIFTLETATAASVGFTLAALFIGGRPWPERARSLPRTRSNLRMGR